MREAAETLAPPTVRVLELPPGPGGTEKIAKAPGEANPEATGGGSQTVGQPKPMAVQLTHESSY